MWYEYILHGDYEMNLVLKAVIFCSFFELTVSETCYKYEQQNLTTSGSFEIENIEFNFQGSSTFHQVSSINCIFDCCGNKTNPECCGFQWDHPGVIAATVFISLIVLCIVAAVIVYIVKACGKKKHGGQQVRPTTQSVGTQNRLNHDVELTGTQTAGPSRSNQTDNNHGIPSAPTSLPASFHPPAYTGRDQPPDYYPGTFGMDTSLPPIKQDWKKEELEFTQQMNKGDKYMTDKT